MVSLGVRMILFLALIAAGIVFRKEVGNAIVWLGMKISGNSAAEISPITQSDNPLPAAPASTDSAPSSAGPLSPAQDNPAPATSAPATTEASQSASAADHKDKSTEGAAALGQNDPDPTVVPEKAHPSPSKNLSAVPPGAVLPVARSSTPPPATGVPGIEPGQPEFLAAQDLLKKNSAADLPEAVKLLWTAVEKGNANAEVALAELYQQGKGVAKNCDQTNILLSAAARKGNPLAQKLLKEFHAESCE